MPAWNPSMPWPGTAGGASSPHWGGYVRLFVRAAIMAGNAFHVGAHAYDRLDSGNVLGGTGAMARAAAPAGRLWADLSCDVLSVDLESGASSSAGIFTQMDAATAQIVLADPEGIYDPAAAVPPFTFGGRSRLVPGVPVEVFAEVVDAPTGAVSTRYLFTGTADSWGEDWTPEPSRRRAVLVATDPTKVWSRYDRLEQPPVGSGDTTAQRVQRIVTYFGWPGTVDAAASSAVTLQPTTLAQPGWEQLTRTLQDELGTVYFTPEGALRWTDRAAWFTPSAPVVELGCAAPDTILSLTGSGRVTTPDTAALGNIGLALDLRVIDVAALDWSQASGGQTLVCQFLTAGGNLAWNLRLTTTGALSLQISANGTAVNGTATSSATLYTAGAVDGQPISLRCTMLAGATDRAVTFYTSADHGATWRTLGAVQTVAGNTPLWNSTGPLEIGSNDNGAGQWLKGTVGRVQVRSAIDGPIAADIDFTAQTPGATTLPALIGGPFTISGSPVILQTSAPLHDVLTDATPTNIDTNMRNVVRAARTGGTEQVAQSTASVAQYGPYEYSRTDLGVLTDVQAGQWASDVLLMSAYPRIVLEDVTMRPAIAADSWAVWDDVLAVDYVTDRVRVVWTPPDRPEAVMEQITRVVGASHRITRSAWEVRWQLSGAGALGEARIFTLGSHANDRLNAGNVLGAVA